MTENNAQRLKLRETHVLLDHLSILVPFLRPNRIPALVCIEQPTLIPPNNAPTFKQSTKTCR